jgi:hypothetical protein
MLCLLVVKINHENVRGLLLLLSRCNLASAVQHKVKGGDHGCVFTPDHHITTEREKE